MEFTNERWPLSVDEALEEAAVVNNIVTADILLNREIAEQQASLAQPHTSEVHVLAEIQRLADLKMPAIMIIDRFDIEEPIDLRFLLDLGDYLDAEEVYIDSTGEEPTKEVRAANINELVNDLHARSVRNFPQAA